MTKGTPGSFSTGERLLSTEEGNFEQRASRVSHASRSSSVVYEDYTGNPTIIYDELIPDTPTNDLPSKGTSFKSSLDVGESAKSESQQKPSLPARLVKYFSHWSEDGAGLVISFLIFILSTSLGFGRQNIDDYAERPQWPLGMATIGIFVAIAAHSLMKKKQAYEAYLAVIAIAIAAQAIGKYNDIKAVGLSGSFWAIILGMVFRYMGLNSTGGVLSGEFFIKIGVTLMAMDFSKVAKVGLPGLMVAWGDTILMSALGTFLAMKVMQMNLKDALVVAGSTCICGSSAATAISASIHIQVEGEEPFVDKACSTVIALMGMLNTPLMPLLPLLHTRLNMNPVIVGSWIGGSVDSTGQVVASASLAGSAVLESATIIKMAQNVLIGPICLALTIYFQKSFKPSILLDKFPLFVVGFFVTSLIANIIKLSGAVSDDISDLIISNSWFLSEWVNLIGFARIGLMIDVNTFIKNSSDHVVLYTYLMVQTLDLVTTLGWSYLLFKGASYEDDDE
jgi:uncharacterized membrane protein YadS